MTAYLVYRSSTRQSLTPLGILTATLTALLHASHASPLPFTLLVVFFLAGTTATKVKHGVKSRYTLSSSSGGEGGGEGARTHVQVLANSGVASLLVLLHLWRVGFRLDSWGGEERHGVGECIPTIGSGQGLILAGVVANYAAVAADTLSSELGILARREPRLVTRPWMSVPRGTNGGVTGVGLGAGMLGALVVAVSSVVVMPFCSGGRAAGLGPVGRVLMTGEREEVYRGWTVADKLTWVVAVTIWGALGSVLDSILGAILQASVVDRRTGKIIEGAGGEKVLLHSQMNRDESFKRRKQPDDSEKKTTPAPQEESRRVLVGLDWLDNNQINLLMAVCMSLGGMGVASWYWGIPLTSLLT